VAPRGYLEDGRPKVERLKVANATVAFVETVRSNHQLYFKVGGVLAKLLRTRIDEDEIFKCFKEL